MKQWVDYFDSYGLVTQRDGEGGDSFNRTPIFRAFQFLKGAPLGAVRKKLRDAFNTLAFRRHADLTCWYSRLQMISRDQLSGMLFSSVITGDRDLVRRLFDEHKRQGSLFFAWNRYHNWQYADEKTHNLNRQKYGLPEWNGNKKKRPDLTLFKIWGGYIRGLEAKKFYWLLYLLDISILLGSIKHVVFPYKFSGLKLKKEDDVIVHSLVVIASLRNVSTFWVKLAALILSPESMNERLGRFFGDYPQEPPFDELMRPTINYYFGRWNK